MSVSYRTSPGITDSIDPEIDGLVAELRLARHRVIHRTVLVLGVVVAIGLGGLVLAVVLGGSSRITLAEIPSAAIGQGSSLANFVVFETRMPRAVTAVLAGALFGLSGVIYQRLVDNPLATPDILGISAGASCGAVIVLVGGGSGLAVQGAALIGAVLAAGLIFVLGWQSSGGTYRLVLMGIGIAACFSALTGYLLILADAIAIERAVRWMIGSLNGASWRDTAILGISLAVGLVAASWLGRQMGPLRLGAILATGVGVGVGPVRLAALLLGAALAAAATSITGPIGFLALVCGPIAARLLPASGLFPPALFGAVLLVWADVAAQNAAVLSPVPTGLLTAVFGAPVLIYLLIRPRTDA